MQSCFHKDAVHTKEKEDVIWSISIVIFNSLKLEPENGLVPVSIRLGVQLKLRGISKYDKNTGLRRIVEPTKPASQAIYVGKPRFSDLL